MSVQNSVQKNQKLKDGLKLLLAFLIPVLVITGTRALFFDNYYIPSASMEKTLMVGDRIIITYVGKDNPQRGDIIVFEDTQNWLQGYGYTDKTLIKRVIGLPGDTVSCCSPEGKVLVNGKPLNEPYAQGTNIKFLEQKVPAGKVFVLGDNREHSADSRYHIVQGTQFIDIKDIKGKAIFTYWPFNTIRKL